MASSPIQSRPLRAALIGGLLAVLTTGCNRPPEPATPSATPPPAVSASPGVSVAYTEITDRYQASPPEGDNGWPLLRPLLGSSDAGEPPLSEKLEAGLDSPADIAYFDQKVLPLVEQAFQKPAFFEPHPLLSGRDPLNFHYRDLRQVCDLITERAEQLWKEGKKSEALELLKLPLGLARAMQSRPETVSVNLFSGPFYANSALRIVAEWASDNTLKGAELEQARQILARHRPSYAHIVDTIAVDFAQFENSLGDETTRTEILGLGLAKPEDVELWKAQMRSLLADAQKLYGLEPGDAQTFNQSVSKMAPQVQGLVGEYPQHSTQQKLAYATFLATEMALTLEKHRQSTEKKPLDAAALLETTFGDDGEARKAAEALLVYKPGPTSQNFAISGKADVFALVVPEAPLFYQR